MFYTNLNILLSYLHQVYQSDSQALIAFLSHPHMNKELATNLHPTDVGLPVLSAMALPAPFSESDPDQRHVYMSMALTVTNKFQSYPPGTVIPGSVQHQRI